MNLNNVLFAPVVTEKSTKAQKQKKYAFLVHADANKIEIGQAIAQIYGAKVDRVHIIPVRKKVRSVGQGRTITKRAARKKAIITLAGKELIDFNKIKVIK